MPDERHMPPTKRKKKDEEEDDQEEDLNDANYDEVRSAVFGVQLCAIVKCLMQYK